MSNFGLGLDFVEKPSNLYRLGEPEVSIGKLGRVRSGTGGQGKMSGNVISMRHLGWCMGQEKKKREEEKREAKEKGRGRRRQKNEK